ncbi:MAG: restriction endonuclease subunit S [Campylobacterales bacterium]|nr:restriction endonuclease subunit S [Campylobacterales bacterium]
MIDKRAVFLEDVCEILDSQRIPLSEIEREGRIKNKNVEDLYPYYGATQQVGYIDDYLFDEELILLGEDGVMFYDRSKPKAYLIQGKSWVNNHAHVLKVNKKIASTKYILNFLNIFNYHGYVSGSTRLKLNRSRMSKIPIPLPSLEQQKSIASNLDKLQNLITLRKESIKKLDDLSKSIFIDMFGDPIENPKGWESDLLREICDFENGDRSSKYPTKNDLVEEGVLFLSSREIVNFKFEPSDSLYITEEKFSSLSQGHCFEGDIILTLRGNGVGKCCVFKGFRKGFINAQMVILRFHKKFIRNDFFINTMKNETMFNNLLKFTSGSAQPQLSVTELKKMKIIMPPLELQNKFAEKIEKIEAQKALYEQQLEKLQYGFDALLQKSFED